MTDESTTQVSDEQQAQGTTPETVEKPAGESKPEVPMIPKPRFDELNQKLKEAQAKAAKLDELEQRRADEEAKKAGDIERFTKERDTYKSEAEQWREYAKDKLGRIADALDDSDKAILDALGDEVSLSKRLQIAEQLSAKTKKLPAGFGSNGGATGGDVTGTIPTKVTTRAEYHAWLAGLSSEPEGRALLRDAKKMAAVQEEARRKFG